MEIYLKLLPSLRTLKFIKEEENTYVGFDELIYFMQQHKLEYEPLIRRDNILKELRNHQNGISELNGKRVISIPSFIRYISNHFDQFDICRKIIHNIVEHLFKKETPKETNSILNLYKKIAELNSITWSQDVLKNIEIPESRTLYTDYITNFNSIQWKKICLFEHHFQSVFSNYLEYDEVKQKEIYFEALKQTQNLAMRTSMKCDKYVSSNVSRKEAADEIHGENFISSHVYHSYTQIESTVHSIMRSYDWNKEKLNGAIVDCFQNICGHKEGIHIFVESCSDSDYEEIASHMQHTVIKTHKLNVSTIVFVKEGLFRKYRCKNCIPGSIHRFQIMDDFYSKIISDDVLFISSNYNKEITGLHNYLCDNSGSKYCIECYKGVSDCIGKPLDWRHFDIKKEWVLHVPLEIQEFYSNIFINTESMRKCENTEQYLKSKLSKLYINFDSGLNIYNKQYTGIVQQLNTEELIVNYHALSTVFNITSKSGCTQSLKTAERWLQCIADANKSYYETYIKRYPLLYKCQGDSHECIHSASLRDCYVILFMDNLVRLTVHEDPNPGQSRTSQICTLPITLKGLPKNCHLTKDWHKSDCHQTDSDACGCMTGETLKKEDLKLLRDHTEQEQEAWEKLKMQTNWGIVTLIEAGDEDDILRNLLHINGRQDTDIVDMEQDISQELKDLNMSMKSLNVADVSEGTEEELIAVLTEDENIYLEEIEASIDQSLSLHGDTTIEEDQFMEGIMEIDYSDDDIEELDNLSLDEEITEEESDVPSSLNISKVIGTQSQGKIITSHFFEEFQIRPLLCRHPQPATGRDDDITNLSQILKDLLYKLGRNDNQKHRILFAPDHKISNNLLKLMKGQTVFQKYLPEFPVLHLRKSKIVNLFSANKSAGLLHLLKYMKDAEQEDDWMRHITIQNIDTATKNITRLSMALHLAFLIRYIECINKQRLDEFMQELESKDISRIQLQYGEDFNKFMQQSYSKNATFALHVDIMQHCYEIVGISVAERIGGPNGYNLLLAAVKSSLPFAFLNGASSYASFCVELLHQHYSAGIFHQNMKMSLFSTPHKDGNVNVALDTQREMDHKDAVKGFRPRSTISSVVPRMTIMDRFTDTHQARKQILEKDPDQTACEDTSLFSASSSSLQLPDNLCKIQFQLTKRDLRHIVPVSKLILQINALSTDENNIPKNMYDCKQSEISDEILDKKSYPVGCFLLHKYAALQEIFGQVKADCPDIVEIEGPAKLLKKAKAAKSVTMRRVTTTNKSTKPGMNTTEQKRQAQVKKKTRVFECMSSAMNTCQSLVNPDCSKTTVQKALGIRKAITKALSCTFQNITPDNLDEQLESEQLLFVGLKEIPDELKKTVTFATIEFAGAKFKTKAISGTEYLKQIENGILRRTLIDFPNLKSVVVCEEKYSFTPDDFKAATRSKRQKTDSHSIAHLKSGDDIISDHKLSKSSVIHTGEGKKLISNYLARNVHKLDIRKNLTIEIDSELILKDCKCSANCKCPQYSLPISAEFDKTGFIKQSVLKQIHQRKGEAEMAQVDWLQHILPKLGYHESVISMVSSADIDSVVIHLFAVSIHWPRNPDGSFKNKVYVLLQKQKPDLYNITGIIERLERHFGFKNAAVNIALICCIGGNDFLPKFYGISHEKWMNEVLLTPSALQKIVKLNINPDNNRAINGYIHKATFMDIVKQLYCPKTINPNLLSIEEVRQLSIRVPGKDYRHPTAWMPPVSALEKVLVLIACQLDYLFTVWDHSACLPTFLESGCLVKDEKGNIHYDFGPDCKVDAIENTISIEENELRNKMLGARKTKREISFSETPEKNRKIKRRPVMSTPVKSKVKLYRENTDNNGASASSKQT